MVARRHRSPASIAALALAALIGGCGGANVEPSPPPDAPTAPAGPIVTTERGPRGGRLVVLDEDGRRLNDLVPIADQPAVDSNPAWSPGGAWVAFVSSRGRGSLAESNLWLVPARGGVARALSRSPAIERDPRWLGDRALVYASNVGGSFDLYRVDLVTGAGGPALGAPVRLTSAPGDELSPALSPDGRALVYMAVDRAAGRSRLERIPLAGGEPVALTDGPADLTPAFSPDGATIVFAAPVEGRGDTDLFAIPAAGGERRVVVDSDESDETGPLFSADGRFLFATAVYRSVTGQAILSSVVVLDQRDRRAGFRALHDPSAVSPRLGVALAPVALDAARLDRNPRYRDALRRFGEDVAAQAK